MKALHRCNVYIHSATHALILMTLHTQRNTHYLRNQRWNQRRLAKAPEKTPNKRTKKICQHTINKTPTHGTRKQRQNTTPAETPAQVPAAPATPAARAPAPAPPPAPAAPAQALVPRCQLQQPANVDSLNSTLRAQARFQHMY